MKSASAATTIKHNKVTLGDTRTEEWAQRIIYNAVTQSNYAMKAPAPLFLLAVNHERQLRHYGYGFNDILTIMTKNSVLKVFVNKTLARYVAETCWWNSLPIETRHEIAKELDFVTTYKDIVRMHKNAYRSQKQAGSRKGVSTPSKPSQNPNERS